MPCQTKTVCCMTNLASGLGRWGAYFGTWWSTQRLQERLRCFSYTFVHNLLKVLKSAKSFPTLTLMGFSEQFLGPRGTLIEPLIPVRPSFHPSAPISPEFIDELKHWHCRQASWTPQIVHFWKPKMSVSKFGENSNTETTELCMMLYVFGKVVTIGV